MDAGFLVSASVGAIWSLDPSGQTDSIQRDRTSAVTIVYVVLCQKFWPLAYAEDWPETKEITFTATRVGNPH